MINPEVLADRGDGGSNDSFLKVRAETKEDAVREGQAFLSRRGLNESVDEAYRSVEARNVFTVEYSRTDEFEARYLGED